MSSISIFLTFFFFNDTATTEIYTLSLHDALPIFLRCRQLQAQWRLRSGAPVEHSSAVLVCCATQQTKDRKSTRLNSSHVSISYAVFCLKKKNKQLYKLLTRNYNCSRNTTHKTRSI